MKTRTMISGLAIAAVGLGSLTACSTAGDASGGDVELEFFQSKTESIAVVDELIALFEEQNPGITVHQNNSPDPLTALKANLAKGNIPDVIALNVSMYNDIARTNILTEQVGTEAAEAVANQTAVDYVDRSGQTESTYALPWTVNAQVVLYDVDTFAALGLEVPTTWDEFVQTAQAVADAGERPFSFTWKDSWTTKLLMNSIVGPTQGADFWEELQEGTSSFAENPAYTEAAERMIQLKGFAEGDPFGATYDDGNAAFAAGESAMYIQGTWALPEIASVNPEKNVGVFALPTGDSADDTLLLSGPDSVVGVSKDSDHAEAAQAFVDFLFSEEAQRIYSEDQHLLSVRDDVAPVDESLAALKEQFLDEGESVMYPDGMFTGASDVAAIAQTLLYDEDVDAFLSALDADFANAGIK